MMIAIENGHNGIARYLMEHNGNPHLWDVYRRTAQYIAVGHAGGASGGGAAPGGARVVPRRVRADVAPGRARVPVGEH